MNVTLPDGTVIHDVPDGTTKAQLAAKLKANGYDVPSSWIPRPDPATRAKHLALAEQYAKEEKKYADKSRNFEMISKPVDALLAFGHHVEKLPEGIAQLAMHGANAVSGGALQAPTNAVDSFIGNEEKQYQNAVPTNAWSVGGAIAGEALPFVAGGIPRGLAAAGEGVAKYVPEGWQLARRMVSGATQGGILAAAQPVTSGPSNTLSSLITGNSQPSFARQKLEQALSGIALGGAAPVVGSALRGVAGQAVGVGRHIFMPQAVADANLARIYGSNPQTVNALRGFRPDIPGVQPTTAQVLATPQAVAAEKAFGNTAEGKIALAERENRSNQARVNALQDIAKTPEDLQAAVNARRTNASKFITENLQPADVGTRFKAAGAALSDTLQNTGRMSQADADALREARRLIGRVQRGAESESSAYKQLQALKPTSKRAQQALTDAMEQIDKGLVNPSRIVRSLKDIGKGSLGTDPTVAAGVKRALGVLSKHTNDRGLIAADVLDGVRQNISSYLREHAGKSNSAVSTKQEAALVPIKAQIVRTLDRAIPGYRAYLATYARDSVPVNTMDTLQHAAGRVSAAAPDSSGTARLTLGHVNQALADAGRSRYAISPEAKNTLLNLRSSIQRGQVSNALRSPGSDTAYNLQAARGLPSHIFGPTLGGPTGVGRSIAAGIGTGIGFHLDGMAGGGIGLGVSAALGKAAKVLNDRIATRYAKGIMDPAEARASIERFLRANKRQAPKLLQQFPQWRQLLAAPAPQAVAEQK